MAKKRRRLRILIAILVVLGVMLGAFIQISTRQALERAEAFQFRRMQVTRLGDDGPYRFFYVTNRIQDRQEQALEEQFGSDRESDLKFGLFDVKFEPSV